MADAEIQIPNFSNEKLKKLKVDTTVSRKTIVKKYTKTSKTIRRRNRRKRSRKAYFKSLRKKRTRRLTEDLCAGLEEFTVIDMETAPICDLTKLPTEITEWQNQDQIAYWKSRAITLEIENRMLQQHLRNVYAQQIEYYEKNKNWKEIPNGQSTINNNRNTRSKQKKCSQSDKDYSSKSSKTSLDSESKPSTSKESSNSETIEDRKEHTLVLPKIPEGKNRLEEMKKIYGDKAPKIMGMETAIQLNYERLVEEGKTGYWPMMPLKL